MIHRQDSLISSINVSKQQEKKLITKSTHSSGSPVHSHLALCVELLTGGRSSLIDIQFISGRSAPKC